jgi:hypothetical protein
MSRWHGITTTLPGREERRCEPATAERFSDVAQRRIVRLTVR